MQHSDVWRAIDALAAKRGLTASGLARAAGLDATTFNKSKRQAVDGHRGLPSTAWRLDLLKVVASSPAARAKPDAVSPRFAASASMARQTSLCCMPHHTAVVRIFNP